jgi:hypothetical protein
VQVRSVIPEYAASRIAAALGFQTPNPVDELRESVLEPGRPIPNRGPSTARTKDAVGIGILELNERERVGRAIAAGDIANEVSKQLKFDSHAVNELHLRIGEAEGSAKQAAVAKERQDVLAFLQARSVSEKFLQIVQLIP